MNRMLVYGLLTSLLALLAACSQTQAPLPEADAITAQGTISDSFKGEGASAYFDGPVEDGCGWVSMAVFMAEGRQRGGGGRSGTTAVANVALYYYDHCRDIYIGSQRAYPLSTEDFTIDRQLGSVRLSKTVEIYDWFSDESLGLLTLDLTWAATGGLIRVRDQHHYDEPGRKYKYRFQGSYRVAAISGTASFEGINLIGGLSGYGEIFRAQMGSMIIEQEQRLPPNIFSFYATPEVIAAGQTSTLFWVVSSDRHTTLFIEGIGDVTGLTSLTVSPSTTTTYTLTATNRNGTTSRWATVTVLEHDEFEPNNSHETAAPIELDFYRLELTLLPGDVDWFTFNLNETTGVFAYTGTWWALDPVMGLLDANLNQIASGSWFGIEELEAGIYYLAVGAHPDTGFSGNHEQGGSYYLNVFYWTPPPPP